MIVVDTSAVVAIAFGEPERGAFVERIRSVGRALVAAPTLVEARIVVHARRGERGVVLLDGWLTATPFEIVEIGVAEAGAAHAAFVAYGRGSGHPAGLNYGDLFAYALAKTRGLPLLYKGEDFALTDVEPAWRCTP